MPVTPTIEMFTQDEMHPALVRAAVARTVPNPDAFLENNDVETRVVYRNVRLPDGSTSLFASVAIFSVRPKTEHTPVPSQPGSKE